MFATGGPCKKSESRLVRKQSILLNSLPINLQGFWYSVLWSSFFVNSNHSHNGEKRTKSY